MSQSYKLGVIAGIILVVFTLAIQQMTMFVDSVNDCVSTPCDGLTFMCMPLAVVKNFQCTILFRLPTCLEVGLHCPTYDTDDSVCHELLRNDELLPPSFDALWQDLCCRQTPMFINHHQVSC